jgi:hypothetical protein
MPALPIAIDTGEAESAKPGIAGLNLTLTEPDTRQGWERDQTFCHRENKS